jgi:tyrosine-protein phosphatase SIW14
MKLGFAWLPCVCAGALLAADRPQMAGVSNFHQVNEGVYRGAQPTSQGFENLARLGVKTVVDLRVAGEHSQAGEKRRVEKLGMRYVSMPIRKLVAPTDAQVTALLELLMDPSASPVFIHCRRGADRTGAVIACYRMAHDHWDSKSALREARQYGMRWYQFALQKYVVRYQPRVNPVTTAASALPISPP